MSLEMLYIAGPYTAKDTLTLMKNMRTGIRLSLKVAKLGYAPYCPWLDFLYGLVCGEDDALTIEEYKAIGMEALRRSDYVILAPGWKTSAGVKEELAEARRLGKPIFESVEQFIEWKNPKETATPTVDSKLSKLARNNTPDNVKRIDWESVESCGSTLLCPYCKHDFGVVKEQRHGNASECPECKEVFVYGTLSFSPKLARYYPIKREDFLNQALIKGGKVT